MLNIQIKAESLKDFVDALNVFVNEARFRFVEGVLTCKAVDAANVGMISIEYPANIFEKFETTEHVLGIDITKLKSILESADKNDVIGMELDDEKYKLKINIGRMVYTMSLIDIKSIRKEPKIPALDLPCQLKINGSIFQRGMKAAEKITDDVMLGCRTVDNNFIFFIEAEGDTDKMTLEVKQDEILEFTPALVQSLYSLDYLSDISKVVGKNDVDIYLGKDLPLKLNCKIAGSGTIEFLVAPCVCEN